MPLLAKRPVTVPMYFVTPHVKPGDYYLMINPVTGRRMWVYPRHMGERTYAVTSALGDVADQSTESPFDISQYLSWIQQQPQQIASQVEETQDTLRRYEMYMKLAIGASLVTSVLAITVFLTRS